MPQLPNWLSYRCAAVEPVHAAACGEATVRSIAGWTPAKPPLVTRALRFRCSVLSAAGPSLPQLSPLLLCSLAVLRLLGNGEALLQPPRRRLEGHRDAALEHPKVLGFVGRLNAAHAADAHSLLVGDGPY